MRPRWNRFSAVDEPSNRICAFGSCIQAFSQSSSRRPTFDSESEYHSSHLTKLGFWRGGILSNGAIAEKLDDNARDMLGGISDFESSTWKLRI